MSKSLLKDKSILDIAKEFDKFDRKEYYRTEYYAIGSDDSSKASTVELRTYKSANEQEIYVLSGSCVTGIEIFEDRLEALQQFVDIASDLRNMEKNRHGH